MSISIISYWILGTIIYKISLEIIALSLANVNDRPLYIIEEPNAKEIRKKFNLTQNEFASMLNISVATLRNREQGRRRPEGLARVLLNVANSNPEVLMGL